MRRAMALAIVLTAVGIAVAVAVAHEGKDLGARCGPGLTPKGARCLPTGAGECPSPLVVTAHGCDAPDMRVLIPAASVAVGPSDWEAEGRVAARSVRVQAFRIDAFEVTRGRWASETSPAGPVEDAARAASGMTRAEASAFCASHGGRLPTEDEWIVAAASAMNPPRRYPWGDTGAVCRRAAWGLSTGPCAHGGDGPDTVGAHSDGDSALGIHDLAGNVAEWVASEANGRVAVSGEGPRQSNGIAKGGSWSDALASELRIWAHLDVDPAAGDARVGFRCAYAP